MTRKELLDHNALEIIRWRREVQFRESKLRQAQMEYDEATSLLEVAIINYNGVVYDTGSESKTENQAPA